MPLTTYDLNMLLVGPLDPEYDTIQKIRDLEKKLEKAQGQVNLIHKVEAAQGAKDAVANMIKDSAGAEKAMDRISKKTKNSLRVQLDENQGGPFVSLHKQKDGSASFTLYGTDSRAQAVRLARCISAMPPEAPLTELPPKALLDALDKMQEDVKKLTMVKGIEVASYADLLAISRSIVDIKISQVPQEQRVEAARRILKMAPELYVMDHIEGPQIIWPQKRSPIWQKGRIHNEWHDGLCVSNLKVGGSGREASLGEISLTWSSAFPERALATEDDKNQWLESLLDTCARFAKA